MTPRRTLRARLARVQHGPHGPCIPHSVFNVPPRADGTPRQALESTAAPIVDSSNPDQRSWCADTNTFSAELARAVHVYVFAVHHHEDKVTVDPLDVNQWTFYVVPTRVLNDRRARQRSISLSALKRLGAEPVGFAALARAIVNAAGVSAAPASEEPAGTWGRAGRVVVIASDLNRAVDVGLADAILFEPAPSLAAPR